jgi:hypothetical protein
MKVSTEVPARHVAIIVARIGINHPFENFIEVRRARLGPEMSDEVAAQFGQQSGDIPRLIECSAS